MLEQVTYNVIGTYASPETLTDDYTDNTKTLHNTKYFRGLQLNYKYTSANNNDVCYIRIETSQDGTNFQPLAVGDSALDDTNVGLASDGGADSADSGIPLKIPKDGTSTAAQAIEGWWSTEKFAARYIKISALDSNNGGTLALEATLFT